MSRPRPIPRPLVVAAYSRIPRRLLLDRLVSPEGRLLGALVAGDAHPHAMATAISNRRLAELTGLSTRTVQRCLEELEERGYLWRLPARDPLALDSLQWAGYRCPWEESGLVRPERVLVLCWRLPQPIREPGGRPGSRPPRDTGVIPPEWAEGPEDVP